MKIKNINEYDPIIIYGAGKYFIERQWKILHLSKNIFFFDDRLSAPPTPIANHQWLNSIKTGSHEKALFLIARHSDKDVSEARTNILSVYPNAEIDHVQSYIKEPLNISRLNALGFSYYEDDKNNIIQGTRVKGVCTINFQGKNSTITLENDIEINNRLNVVINGNRGSLKIGKGTTFVETYIEIGSDGIVSIGDDCMFSYDVKIYQSDQHLIFNKSTGRRINLSKHVQIADHIWVGRSVTLLGGFSLGEGSVVGAKSVSSGKFSNNIIIAGSPAKIIREDVIWDRQHAKDSVDISHISQLKQYWNS